MAGSDHLGLSVPLLVIVVAVCVPWFVEAQQFGLTHRYAHLEGSPARSGGKGASQEYFETLVAHDRRRLVSFVTFNLEGSFLTTGLYYTQISLGTPPRQYNVFVDTGSDLMWVNCAPCTNCPLRSTIPGITLNQYDPSLSSSEKVLPCASGDCQIATDSSRPPVCTDPVEPDACSYEINYVDGSGSNGYILKDVMTFNSVVNGNDTVSTAQVYFGCGHNQTGNLQEESAVVDGLMGLGVSAITIPNQIAPQRNTTRMFAHCLQGSNVGGGIIVMGNITEPDVVFTPMVPDQPHFNLYMENIAVKGVNITTPSAFDIKQVYLSANLVQYVGGVILDSGSTFGLLVDPVYDEFVAAVEKNKPTSATVFKQRVQSRDYTCFSYSGDIAGAFPEVTLYFKGGAVMGLIPRNYLAIFQFSSGEAYCIAWSPSPQYTILGDIVLQDQLVVYDIDKQRVGWKPFDCSKAISVGSSTYTAPSAPQGSGSSSQGAQRRMSIYLLSSCLAVAFLLATLL
jgi:hypothetical protein